MPSSCCNPQTRSIVGLIHKLNPQVASLVLLLSLALHFPQTPLSTLWPGFSESQSPTARRPPSYLGSFTSGLQRRWSDLSTIWHGNLLKVCAEPFSPRKYCSSSSSFSSPSSSSRLSHFRAQAPVLLLVSATTLSQSRTKPLKCGTQCQMWIFWAWRWEES